MGRIAFPVVLGVLGAAVLVALGMWQVQRLDWKADVLADIEARILADPIAVPDTPDPETDRYLPVTATGLITDAEIHLLISTREAGPAFRIVSRFETEDGRRLLLDRGYVDDQAKDAPRPPVTATVTGNLHWPDEIDGFTPDNDRANNIWFARDLEAMSAALGTEPVLVVLRSSSEIDVAVTPLPVDTAGIPNDHLEYAVTWFGLAAVWVAMTLFWIVRILRGRS
jgi:surfeit locus 1 family protein